MKKLIIALALVGVLGAGAYWWFLGPRTTTVEGHVGPANSIAIKAYVKSDMPLGGLAPGFAGRNFRLRYWDIYKGGIVPIHSHKGRPATIYVVNGEIKEFRNGSEKPIIHRGGEISNEVEGLTHHWRNDFGETVYLVASDIYNTGKESISIARPDIVREITPPEPDGTSEEELAVIDLAGEAIGVTGYALRTRRIEIAPGGVSAVQRLDAGPLNVFVLEGEITEASTSASTNETLSETTVHDHLPGTQVYWRNDTASGAVLIVSDIIGYEG